MAEKDSLHMVCLEPLLYAFQAPRTIATALAEYEEYLRTERGLPFRRARAALRALEQLLDPLDAPLVSLTPEMARALLLQEDAQPELQLLGGAPARCLSQLRARRFFRWAIARGYVSRNPFDGIHVPLVEEHQTEWLA